MSIIIESGVGDGNRLAVFDDRLRELEVQQSATNYISTSQLGGRTGVFTISTSARAILSATSELIFFAVSNNDPINLMVIDRVYVQIISSTITLPDTRFIIALSRRAGTATGTVPSIRDENKFSQIIPLVTPTRQTEIGTPILAENIIRIYPTLGDIEELIPQGSDVMILPGKITPASGTLSFNTIAVSAFYTTSPTIFYNAFIKFMMVPPDSLG